MRVELTKEEDLSGGIGYANFTLQGSNTSIRTPICAAFGLHENRGMT